MSCPSTSGLLEKNKYKKFNRQKLSCSVTRRAMPRTLRQLFLLKPWHLPMGKIIFMRLFSLHKVRCDKGLRHPSLRAKNYSKWSRFNQLELLLLPWQKSLVSKNCFPHHICGTEKKKRKKKLWSGDLFFKDTSICQRSTSSSLGKIKTTYIKEAAKEMDIDTFESGEKHY